MVRLYVKRRMTSEVWHLKYVIWYLMYNICDMTSVTSFRESFKNTLADFFAEGVLVPPHNGPKSLILAPRDIPDISGYQLGIGCQFVKARSNEIPGTGQKIF